MCIHLQVQWNQIHYDSYWTLPEDDLCSQRRARKPSTLDATKEGAVIAGIVFIIGSIFDVQQLLLSPSKSSEREPWYTYALYILLWVWKWQSHDSLLVCTWWGELLNSDWGSSKEHTKISIVFPWEQTSKAHGREEIAGNASIRNIQFMEELVVEHQILVTVSYSRSWEFNKEYQWSEEDWPCPV